MKNILYLRQTGIYNDSRANKEIDVLEKNGYRVIVLGWNRDGKSDTVCSEKFAGRNIEFHFFQKKLEHGSGLKGLKLLLQFNLWIGRFVKKHRGQLGFIHSCDLDTAIVSGKSARRYKIPFVYDIFDYYIDAHHVPGALRRFIEKAEISTINGADAVIICLESRKLQIQKASPKRLYVIDNSPDIQSLETPETISPKSGKEFDLVYVGSLSESRLLKEIVDRFPTNGDLRLHIGGYGNCEDYIRNAAENNANITFYGSMEYKDVLRLEQKCDVLFSTYDPSVPNHRFSAPNKVYEAMALSKPIIVCKNTGVDRLAEDSGFGIAIDYNVESFFEAVNVLARDRGRCSEMGKIGRRLYDSKYSWTEMSRRLLEIYRTLEDEL